jgi:hypothetical protein
VGKTTAAKLLAARWERAVHLESDSSALLSNATVERFA